MNRHPSTEGWAFPPAERPPVGAGVQRANLRELAARPGRFEHHLTVVAAAGVGRLELATASEPLYFAHENLSDELAVALPTGHPMLDALPFRTFLSDRATGEDVARVQHRVGDLVLHPLGWAHWPGRLRPPFTPPAFPEGMRRAGLSLVFCAGERAPVHPARPLGVSAGREDAVRGVTPGAVPVQLRGLLDEPASQVVARVGDATLELLVAPTRLDAPRGGYLLVLDAAPGSSHAVTDLWHVPAGASPSLAGVRRALWLTAEVAADPPPPAWSAAPTAPFAPAEDAPRGALPLSACGLSVIAVDDEVVALALGEPGTAGAAPGAGARVPRYWLARLLFRLALHGYRVGRIETYGGFAFDDREGPRFELRGGGALAVAPAELPGLVEALYRAVAPPGYRERV